MKDFRSCKECDFEWHVKDGFSCPICSKKEKRKAHSHKEWGEAKGLFYNGGDFGNFSLVYAALGMVVIVALIYSILGANL